MSVLPLSLPPFHRTPRLTLDRTQSSRYSRRSTFSGGTASARRRRPRTRPSTSRCVPPLPLFLSLSLKLSIPDTLPPLTQFFAYNEAPLFLQFSPPSTTSSSSSPSKDLPVAIYESTLELVAGQPEPVFVPCAYEIVTGEAERVAVEGVSKPEEGTEGGAGGSCASLPLPPLSLPPLSLSLPPYLSYTH